MPWWGWALAAGGALAGLWVLLVVALLVAGRRSDARALAGFIPDCLVLVRRLLGDERVPRRRKLLLVALALYLASPIDIVPDLIPVAGQLDDVVVLLLTLRRAIRVCPAPLAGDHLARAGLTEADFDSDLAACRATARWLAAQGLRFGGRVAGGVGRRLWSAVRPRVSAGSDRR